MVTTFPKPSKKYQFIISSTYPGFQKASCLCTYQYSPSQKFIVINSFLKIFILPEYSSVILPFPTSSSMQILNIFFFSPEPFGRWEATVMANLGWEEIRSGPVCLSRYMVMVMMMVMVILKSYRSWFGLSFCIIR